VYYEVVNSLGLGFKAVMSLCIGPTSPNAPSIQRSIPYSTEALVSWRVGKIAYTQENYHVEFGVSNDALTMRSEAVNGSSNLTSINQLYSVTLTGLDPFTQYYYTVVATNSFITAQTTVQAFQTTEAGVSTGCQMNIN